MADWNPTQYLKFGEERTQPCRDLVARVAVANPRRVMDLGCGPGNSTQVLADRWPNAEITGLDSSPDMIEAARKADPRHRWIVGDIADWARSDAGRFDVLFSNAAMQWVGDHATVYPQLLARVAEGGALAVQTPANFNEVAHRMMREVAASPAWSSRFATGRVREWFMHPLEFYYDLLAPAVSRLDLWTTEYLHVMPSAKAIVEWYRSTGLRPFLDLLGSQEERDRFEADYLEALRPHYIPRSSGGVLFAFRRTFLVAYPA